MSEDNAVELYRKHRPSKLSDMIGQKEAVDQIVDMGKRGVIPHAMLFTGPSGCGKTTLARIIRCKLGCSDEDYQELNASDARGIDEVRSIRSKIGYAPMNGKCRVILIDEVHGLTSDAQEAFLKLLEDTPKHIYFFLCTTNPQKLKKTIITRCTEVRCKPLSEDDLCKLIAKVSNAEGKALDEEVVRKIARVADGSARKALVLLHAVIGLPSKTEQLLAIEAGDATAQARDLCRLLMKDKVSWKEVSDVLKGIEEEAESIRRAVLGYSQAALLNGGSSRAAEIIERFWLPLYDVGKPGLVANCYALIKG